MKGHSDGFTIVELLISISLLAILITSISLPITTFLGMNRRSATTINATSDAQHAMERARQLVLANYSSPQTALGAESWPTNITVTCADVTVQGTVRSATCQTVTPTYVTPDMRRITVVATVDGAEEARMNLEVRP